MLLSRSWIYINTLLTPTFIRNRLYKWRNLLLISTAYNCSIYWNFLHLLYKTKE